MKKDNKNVNGKDSRCLTHNPSLPLVPAPAPGNNPAHPLLTTEDSHRRHHHHDLAQYIILNQYHDQPLDLDHTAVTH